MNVVFFRHGPAVPHGTAGVSDADRPLTPEGRKKTAQAAKGLKALDLGIDAIYTSPLPRAVQTAEILGKRLRLKVEPIDELRPESPPRKLLDAVRVLRAESPLLVGHEPMLSAAVSLAVSGTAAGRIRLKKAGAAVLEWSGGRRGTLAQLLTPAVLRRLGR